MKVERPSGMRGDVVLGLAALALVVGVALPVLDPGPALDARFQRASGGLGLGASSGAAWSFFAFDPRLAPSCEAELSPVPGGPCYVPHHGTAAVDLPALGP